jgi:hypothetical protein
VIRAVKLAREQEQLNAPKKSAEEEKEEKEKADREWFVCAHTTRRAHSSFSTAFFAGDEAIVILLLVRNSKKATGALLVLAAGRTCIRTGTHHMSRHGHLRSPYQASWSRVAFSLIIRVCMLSHTQLRGNNALRCPILALTGDGVMVGCVE